MNSAKWFIDALLLRFFHWEYFALIFRNHGILHLDHSNRFQWIYSSCTWLVIPSPYFQSWWLGWCSSGLSRLSSPSNQVSGLWMPDWRPCLGKFPRGTWPQNSDTEQQKWPQMTQRLVESVTATEKSANTNNSKYWQWDGFLLNTQNDWFWNSDQGHTHTSPTSKTRKKTLLQPFKKPSLTILVWPRWMDIGLYPFLIINIVSVL